MDSIMAIVEYVKTHLVEILAVYSGVVTIASIIVKLTPTTADDAILGKIIAFMSKYIALNKDKTSGK